MEDTELVCVVYRDLNAFSVRVNDADEFGDFYALKFSVDDTDALGVFHRFKFAVQYSNVEPKLIRFFYADEYSEFIVQLDTNVNDIVYSHINDYHNPRAGD